MQLDDRTEATLRAGSRAAEPASCAVFGPGLVVMLADTDVGSVITAGQSGVQWGYRLLLLQLCWCRSFTWCRS